MSLLAWSHFGNVFKTFFKVAVKSSCTNTEVFFHIHIASEIVYIHGSAVIGLKTYLNRFNRLKGQKSAKGP